MKTELEIAKEKILELEDQIKNLTSNTVLANRILQCDICGCHPSVIITTEFGTFCTAHAKYIR